MEKNIIYLGDCLETLKQIPDNSVDCCVTSPPYYALRDYGTGHWEGGDPNCNHEEARKKTRFDYAIDEKQSSSKGTDRKEYQKVCPICGAVRVDDQIGLEETPEAYIEKLTQVFEQVRRVLKPEGTCWINIGDSYSGNCSVTSTGRCGMGEPRERIDHRVFDGIKPKDLIGIPWMLAFELRKRGWYLRQDIIWHKPNPMPESVTDRCTKSHEYIFLLSKSQKYFFDYESIQEEAVTQNDPRGEGRTDYIGKRSEAPKGSGQQSFISLKKKSDNKDSVFVRNKRDVWSVNVRPSKEAHFATYPEMLIRDCILAGCPENGIVLDPFMGSGTTALVCVKLNRNYIGCELNPDYKEMAERRITEETEDRLF